MGNKTLRHQRNRVGVKPYPKTTAIANAVAGLPNAASSVPNLTLVESGIVTQDVNNDPMQRQKRYVFSDKFEPFTAANLRQLIVKLNELPGVTKGPLFNFVPGAMTDHLRGLHVHNFPLHLAFLQELGVVRQFSINWEVIDLVFYDEMVNDAWIERVKGYVEKHIQLVGELNSAKKRIAKLEAAETSVPATPPVAEDTADQALVFQVAQLLGDNNQLKSENEARAAVIADLQGKLANAPKVTSADLAQYLASLRTPKA